MGCKVIELEGSKMIVCSRGRRKVEKCHYCEKDHIALCDYPLDEVATCDRKLCRDHAIHPPGCISDVDYCPEHWKEIPKMEIVNGNE